VSRWGVIGQWTEKAGLYCERGGGRFVISVGTGKEEENGKKKVQEPFSFSWWLKGERWKGTLRERLVSKREGGGIERKEKEKIPSTQKGNLRSIVTLAKAPVGRLKVDKPLVYCVKNSLSQTEMGKWKKRRRGAVHKKHKSKGVETAGT